MAENGELVTKVRARALLKCSYPTLQRYEEAGELQWIEDEDGKTGYRMADIEALLQSKEDIDQSVSGAVSEVTRMIRGFERNAQELIKLAIEPVKITLSQWEKLNEANSATRAKLEDENQRLRDKYHGVLIKLEEMLDGESKRKLEEEQALASEKRKDAVLDFLTAKAGPSIVDQVNRTIGLKTKAQPLLDLVDRMQPSQIKTLLSVGLIDKVQAEALCSIKGIKLEEIKEDEDVTVLGTAGETTSDR